MPEFKGAIEGYVVNSLAQHFWRIQRTHERQEAMQEAHYVFLKLAARYPLLDSPAHFMGLFKTSWSRHLTDLAYKATEARALVPEASFTDEDGQSYSRDVVGDADNDGMLAVMLNQAPAEIKMVLSLLLNAPQELLDLAMSSWRGKGKYKSDGDAFICQALGLPKDSRPLEQVAKYFGSD